MSDGVLLALFLFCMLASCFFSGAETALTSVSEPAVFRLKEQGRPGAERLERLRGELPQTLSTLLVGNTLANIAAGSIGTALAIPHLGEEVGVLIATVATTLVLLIFSEVTPKTLATKRPEEFALFVSRPVEYLVRMLAPLTNLLSGAAALLLRPLGTRVEGTDVTEADVRSLISLSHEQGSLETEEKEILHAVLTFADTPVKNAMVTRARIVSLPVNATFDEVEAICREHRFSRFPVWRESIDDVIGFLHVKDLFDVTDLEEKNFNMARHLRPAVFVPELKRAGDLFREMRRRRFHMAIVVDELGAISGLVTLEDLVEQVFGEIADEHDEPARRPLTDGTSWILEGSYPLASLERDLATSLDEPDVATVAGFLLKRFGRIPPSGARFRTDTLELVVERASPRSIERIRITRNAGTASREKRTST